MSLLQTALYVTVMMIGMKAEGRCDSYITRLGITTQGFGARVGNYKLMSWSKFANEKIRNPLKKPP